MTADLATVPQALHPIEPIATHMVASADGTRLHVREWGRRDGQDIVFVHGWSQCDLCWAQQVRGTLAERFHLITFDLRGHGHLRAHGEDGIGAIALVGASVRLTPPYDGIGPGMLENVADMCGEDLLANIAATRRFLAALSRRPRTPAETETALAWNMIVPTRVREALRAREIDVADVFAATMVPMLVTHGREDAIVLPVMARELLERCPSAAVSWYDGVGHAPFWEAPDRFDLELAALAERASHA
jgi:non-heme chloroperoxidase